MTAPREILPGRTYLITRRCTQRQFLLRPDEKTTAIFQYCLGEAAARFSIDLIAWAAMSNHYHAVVHDPEGKLPRFLEHLHKMLARSLNDRWGRWENLWSTEQTCVTYLATPATVFEKVVYVLTNPVAADLVDQVVLWPGTTSFAHLDGRTTRHARPTSFFRENGKMPTEVELRVVPPPNTSETASDWATRVREEVAKLEKTARDERSASGRRIFGRKELMEVSPFDSPSTTAPRRNLRPAVACKEEPLRVTVLTKLMEFRMAYQAARARFIEGDRSVEFPPGTYRFRLWGVCCAPPPMAA